MSKTSKFVPLAGTIAGATMIILDGFHTEAFSFTLDPSTFWAFMAFTVGGSAAYGIFKRLKH